MRAPSPVVEDADSALALLLSAARGAQASGYGAEDTERLVKELATQLGMSDAHSRAMRSCCSAVNAGIRLHC